MAEFLACKLTLETVGFAFGLGFAGGAVMMGLYITLTRKG